MQDVNTKDEYVVNIKHPDYILYDGELQLINAEQILTTNKKTLVHRNILSSNSIDLNFIIYPKKHKKFELSEYIPSSYLIFQNRFVEWNVYPLSILIQMCRRIAKEMTEYYDQYKEFLNEIIKIDSLYYETLYKTEINRIEFDYDVIYSNYNPYTLTNRPTNSSFGIHLSALSKKDNTRTKLKSAYDKRKIMQFDYSSFHVYLLTKILNFKLPENTDIYLHLNSLYEYSSKTSREEIKMDFFKYIYGTGDYNSELSIIINKFKESLFSYYNKHGYVYSFFLKRKIFFNSEVTITQSNKLFNYYLQNAETEYNLIKIRHILAMLENKDCNLLLYTFDSFLFDYDEKDSDLILEIKNLLEIDGIPVTVQIGDDYGNLNDIY